MSTYTSPNVPLADQLESWAKQLQESARTLRNSSSEPSLHDLVTISNISQGIKKVSQSPEQHMMDNITNAATFAAIRLLLRWNVFNSIPPTGSISYPELAGKVGAEEALIRRFAGILVATGVLEQIGEDQVAHTKVTQGYASGGPAAAFCELGFDQHFKIIASMPSYFDEYGLKEPTGRIGTISAFAMGDPNITVWEHFSRDPKALATFSATMAAAASRTPVVGSYDFSWLVSEAEKSKERALLVDVGGSKGHAVETIIKATPGLPADRCVVEDLPEVVELAKEKGEGILAEVQYVPIDFHEDQPIKGACLYYIRRCLHDYGDSESTGILKQIAAAMAPDSRLLIVEELLSNPPNPMAATADIIMATLGGKERTLENFEAVTGEAGLKIVKAHRTEDSTVALIECIKG